MNKRIKELAIRARLSYVMVPDKPYIEEDLEKFAESIIEESVQYLKDCDYDSEAEQLMDYWRK